MKKGAILFPGQGVQYLGMGRNLYEKYSLVKEIYKEASDYAGFDIAKFCFEGNSKELRLTEYTQPAVLVSGYASAKVLQDEYGFLPKFLAGHSLGEITSVVFSNGISLQDGVNFVRLRGKYMQEAVKIGEGAMSAVIGIDTSTINQVCEETSKDGHIVEISNINSLVQTVISGHKEAVERAEIRLSSFGAKIIRLNVSAPFHCILMQPAVEKLEPVLNKIELHTLQIPVVSSVTGMPYLNEKDIKKMWLCQLTHPVEWTKCMKFLIREGITLFVDVGPGDTMKNLALSNGYGFEIVSLDKEENAFERFSNRRNRAYEDRKEFVRRVLGVIESTKSHISSAHEFDEKVKKPYESIKELYLKCVEGQHDISEEEKNFVIVTFQDILTAKQVSTEEQDRYLRKILCETGCERGTIFETRLECNGI